MSANTIRIGRREYPLRANLLDRAISYVAPTYAQQRIVSRLKMEVLASGGYTGGSKSKRSMSGWKHTQGQSADADLLPDLDALRDRSRDLVRNEPLACGAINTVVTNVVGTGLMLQSQIDAEFLGMTAEEAAAWQTNTEREFAVFVRECDVARRIDFYAMQDIALRSTLEAGDVFVLTPMLQRAGDAYALKLQLTEADRVRNPVDKRETTRFAGGIEMDEYGAPQYAHIARVPVSDIGAINSKTVFDRVPMFGANSGRRNVLHLCRQLRVGQTRGAPYLAPVIEPLKQLGRYTEAEVSAAVVSAFFAVFIKGNANSLSPLDSAVSGNSAGAAGDNAVSTWDGKLSPGLVADLGPGEDIVSANPGRPNPAFDPFVQAVLRQIGAALELPFEILIKHYTASYSAARAAILEAWRFYRGRRAWLASVFCQPVYELFLEEAIARDRISAPGFFDDPRYRLAYSNAMWNGDGQGYLNPKMEAEAAQLRLGMGLTTLKSETAEYNGGDWDSNHAQQVREHTRRMADGLDAEPAPASTAAPDGNNEADSNANSQSNAETS